MNVRRQGREFVDSEMQGSYITFGRNEPLSFVGEAGLDDDSDRKYYSQGKAARNPRQFYQEDRVQNEVLSL